MTARRPLAALIVEDSEDDAVLLVEHLRDAGFEPRARRVDRADAFVRALEERPWDVILVDHALPRFNDQEALALLHQSGQDIPFILVSAVASAEHGARLMHEGAHDYLAKADLSRLAPIIERELRQAEERAKRREAERELLEGQHLENVLAIVSHELRAPLQALELRIHLARRALGREAPEIGKAISLLEKASGDVERVTRLSNDLIDATRMRNGEIDHDMQSLDLCEIVSAAAARLSPHVVASGGTLEIDTACSAMGMFDRLRMEQVVTNLVNNAVRYAPGSPIALAVKVTHEAAAELRVTDQGPGIPADKWRYIFERFASAEVSGSRGGLGLGLYIVERIVARHGGQVRVERSATGEGTTMLVVLPIRRGAACAA
jgi:signal transduction histidine kinase